MNKLRALRFFVQAVESGSFAAAAHALDVVPSALSKTIMALEGDLGFTLFNRSTRKLALTVAVFPRGRQVPAKVRAFLEFAKALLVT